MGTAASRSAATEAVTSSRWARPTRGAHAGGPVAGVAHGHSLQRGGDGPRQQRPGAAPVRALCGWRCTSARP